MKNFSLISRKWIQGGVGLFALYAALHSGGIAVRLGMLGLATGCFALWSRSKQALDAQLQVARMRKMAMDTVAVESQTAMQPKLGAQFVKMPVRYPKPVYIHRSEFHLHEH